MVTVGQADANPASREFIRWKTKPRGVPATVPVVNMVLGCYGLPPVNRLAELCVGGLTLVTGMPETYS